MSSSYTVSETITFTITHAKHMAAKVATDLKRMQRMYGFPNDLDILKYEAEVIEMLKGGYLDNVTYGFRRDGAWIEPTLRYSARDLAGGTTNDDDPGRIKPGANILGAVFYSYLIKNAAWNKLSQEAKEAFQKMLPFQRTGAPEPGINGYLASDKIYSSGGRALERAMVRAF